MKNGNVQIADLFVPFFESSSPETTAAPATGTKADKAAAALKNHSEAEKRRRERINGHFATLRTLIPGSSKMEKSTLLANAIAHLKQLQTAATEATRGLIIPLDSDEIVVEEDIYVLEGEALMCIKASVCCDYTHEILTDMKRALNALQLKLLRVEMGTFQGRMKSVFLVSSYGERGIENSRSQNKCVSGPVKKALRSVLDSFYVSQELAFSRDSFSSKRQRIPVIDCSNGVSSSSGVLW